jgi:hypothetical protein
MLGIGDFIDFEFLPLVSYSAPLRSVYNIIDFVQHEYKLG